MEDTKRTGTGHHLALALAQALPAQAAIGFTIIRDKMMYLKGMYELSFFSIS